MIIENVESNSDQQSESLNASRQVSIVSVESDENKPADDDPMEDLLNRIKKQRSDLENMLGIERKAEEEKLAKKQNKAATKEEEKVDKEGIFHTRDFKKTTTKTILLSLFFYSNSKKNSLHTKLSLFAHQNCVVFLSLIFRILQSCFGDFFDFALTIMHAMFYKALLFCNHCKNHCKSEKINQKVRC